MSEYMEGTQVTVKGKPDFAKDREIIGEKGKIDSAYFGNYVYGKIFCLKVVKLTF